MRAWIAERQAWIAEMRAKIAELRAWIDGIRAGRKWLGAAGVEPRGTMEHGEAAWLKLGRSGLDPEALKRVSVEDLPRSTQPAEDRGQAARQERHVAVHRHEAKRANEDADA
ncbi:hypothetical protein PF010_g15517 [Phytophthora fragariae]|uniref:Uncharacterized protein n=2 Tax=Phytophthora fragariae TaxID=53985 RepID=A0A6G0KU98_9STRA|nr:hypothetical protein PF010_g15517 [Phytophthora fragariae]KAE9240994.1 hypothetical protein PF004_g7263 [Phytophthora fragariae]